MPEQEPIDAEIVEDNAAPPPVAPIDYTEGGVPTFDYVRDRIEGKYATSIGANELAEETVEAASIDKQMEEREQAGRDKLEEIRRSMRGE